MRLLRVLLLLISLSFSAYSDDISVITTETPPAELAPEQTITLNLAIQKNLANPLTVTQVSSTISRGNASINTNRCVQIQRTTQCPFSVTVTAPNVVQTTSITLNVTAAWMNRTGSISRYTLPITLPVIAPPGNAVILYHDAPISDLTFAIKDQGVLTVLNKGYSLITNMSVSLPDTISGLSTTCSTALNPQTACTITYLNPFLLKATDTPNEILIHYTTDHLSKTTALILHAPSAGHVYCWGKDADERNTPYPILKKNLPENIIGGETIFNSTTNYRKFITTDKKALIDIQNQQNYLAIAPDVIQTFTTSNIDCYLFSTGIVSCSGYNTAGELGRGYFSSYEANLAPVTGLTDKVIQITGGKNFVCALLTTGSVACWGSNTNHLLGNFSGAKSATPILIQGFSEKIVQLSSGYRHSCALTEKGNVLCWGQNNHGALGNNSTQDSATPVYSLHDQTIVQISASFYQSCALSVTGNIFCWGLNSNSSLGTGSTSDFLITPTPVSGIQDAIQIAEGAKFGCAVHSDHTVSCWGDNEWGEIGDGSNDTAYTPKTVIDTNHEPLANISGLTTIGQSSGSVCALTSDKQTE